MVARAFERDSLFSLIAGPLVWTVHFLTLYILTAIACAHGFFHQEILGVRVVPLVGGAVTLVAVALILDAVVLAYRRWRGMPVRRRARSVAAARRQRRRQPAPLHGLCRPSALRPRLDRDRLGDPADPVLRDLRVNDGRAFAAVAQMKPQRGCQQATSVEEFVAVRRHNCDFRGPEKLTYWKNGISWVRSVFERRRDARCSPVMRN